MATDTDNDGELGSPSQRWASELEASKKSMQTFLEQAPRVVKRYLNRVEDNSASGEAGGAFPIFWSNVNIQKAAMYARMPKADVSRRYADAEDDVGRVAGEIMERLLNFDMADSGGDVDEALKQVIEDRLVPGMGQVWLRYEPTLQEVEPLEGEVVDEQGGGVDGAVAEGEGPEHEAAEEEIVDERIACDYVHWNDFLFSPARNWRQVRWVAKRVWMTKAQLVERFGEEIASKVPLQGGKGNDRLDNTTGAPPADPWRKAGVWEIWCKDTRKVYWKVMGYKELLDTKDSPHTLTDFFPCPRPLLANVTTSALMPKSDYAILRKVYGALETVSERIELLEAAIRVIGVYDKTNTELKGMLTSNAQNVMIPVDEWAVFAEKGGVKGAIEWFPLDMVVDALVQLRTVKASKLQELYELTGLSDIMRGATDPDETATAQSLKSQFASVRLQFMQGEFARFVQDMLVIKAEMTAQHFQPETLIRKSLIEMTPDAQHADAAIALLKDKFRSHYSLKVEPDSMALVNDKQEQEAARNYLAAFSMFLKEAAPLAQSEPRTLPFLLRILQATMARYKFGKTVEGILDQAITQIMQTPAQPKQPSPQELADIKHTESETARNFAAAKKQSAEADSVPSVTAKNLAQAINQEQNAGVHPDLTGNPVVE